MMRLSPADGGWRRRSGSQRSASDGSSDGMGSCVGQERGGAAEQEAGESDWSSDDDDDGDADLDGGALRRRYRRARALVDSVLNKFHNGSARAVDPAVARALQQHEPRLLSLQCFIEQGSIDRQRAQKGDSAAAAAAPPSSVSRWFSVCGGYLGPGAVMRQWDELSSSSEASEALAMCEYVALMDAMLPRWDAGEFAHPVTPTDCFWQDDASTTQCQYCGAGFSASAWSLQPCRRHHCRLCLAIFCGECSAQFLPLALCPGAPVRRQRVCRPCFQRAQRDVELAASRRLMRENRELERQLQELQTDARRQMDARRRREDALRLEASACGCDMDAIDAAVASRLARMSGGVGHSSSASRTGSSLASSSAIVVALALDTPPAHRFAPTRASVEAGEQLALAHRQLQMALRAAQCRSRRALAQMDAILDELRAAVSSGSGAGSGGSRLDIWSSVLLRTRRGQAASVSAFLALRDLKALARTCSRLRDAVTRHKCEAKCIAAHDMARSTPAVPRAAVWQAECLRDAKTRAYVADLADEVRARLDSSASSSSSSISVAADELEDPEHASMSRRPWLQLLSTESSVPSAWHRAYALLLTRCELEVLEFDAQIQCDVQRTFGASALRRSRPARKTYASASSPHAPLAASEADARRQALANVLRTFACVNSEIGYCQGMDHVAALVLSVVDWDEARAFWLLTSLVASRHYELDLLFGPGLPRLNLRCFQLERLVAMHLPALAHHLAELEFPISMFATGWFMTLFTNMEALPYDVVVRVLDGFLVAGWKQLFRVALVILETLQHHLIASGFDEIPQILFDLQDYAPRLAVAEEVIARAATFKVTNSILKRLQHEYESLEAPGRTSVSDAAAVISRASSAEGTSTGSGSLLAPSPPSSSTGRSVALSCNGLACTLSVSTDHSLPATGLEALEAHVEVKQTAVEANRVEEDNMEASDTGGGKSKRARRRSRRRSSASKAAAGTVSENVVSADATRGASPLVDV